jgi:hypothetical protein
MPADTVLSDPAQWTHLQAAMGRMVTGRGLQTTGVRRDPSETGLLRSASRRGIASSEYAKVLDLPSMKAELMVLMTEVAL